MTDNTDRAIKELKMVLDGMPTPAINSILSKWFERIDFISNLSKNGIASQDLIRERKILRKCLTEIQSAWYIDQGNSIKGFNILLENEKE